MQGSILKQVDLEADSPRQARYTLTLFSISGGYVVEKQSGAMGRKATREAWFREALPEAERKFGAILRMKTNPLRKSSRRYEVKEPSIAQTLLF